MRSYQSSKSLLTLLVPCGLRINWCRRGRCHCCWCGRIEPAALTWSLRCRLRRELRTGLPFSTPKSRMFWWLRTIGMNGGCSVRIASDRRVVYSTRFNWRDCQDTPRGAVGSSGMAYLNGVIDVLMKNPWTLWDGYMRPSIGRHRFRDIGTLNEG